MSICLTRSLRVLLLRHRIFTKESHCFFSSLAAEHGPHHARQREIRPHCLLHGAVRLGARNTFGQSVLRSILRRGALMAGGDKYTYL